MTPLEPMTAEECFHLLGTTTVGRVAVTAHAMPAVVPVNFALSGHAIVFRTRPDGLLARACDDAVVAFEIDELQSDGRSGWSVLVVGVARVLSGSDALRANELNLVCAAGDDRDLFISIAVGRVTGRRAGTVALLESDLRGRKALGFGSLASAAARPPRRT